MNTITALLLLSAIVLTLDAIWIKLIMASEYTSMIHGIQNTSMMVRFVPVLITYILIIGSIWLLAYPHVQRVTLLRDSL